MPHSVYALLILCLIGTMAPSAAGQTVKEFQTSEGLVRIMSVPISTGDGDGLSGSDSAEAPVTALSLDTLTEIAALPYPEKRFDPLIEVYFLNYSTGAELRFPARISQFRNFLALNAARYAGGTPDSRSVAVVRDLSRELSVQMRKPGQGGLK